MKASRLYINREIFMGQQKGEKKLDKVLNGKDVVVTAFGAMIGWGWVG